MGFQVECEQCRRRLVIPDGLWEKRFAGRLQAIKCKSCGGRIPVDGRGEGAGADASPAPENAASAPAQTPAQGTSAAPTASRVPGSEATTAPTPHPTPKPTKQAKGAESTLPKDKRAPNPPPSVGDAVTPAPGAQTSRTKTKPTSPGPNADEMVAQTPAAKPSSRVDAAAAPPRNSATTDTRTKADETPTPSPKVTAPDAEARGLKLPTRRTGARRNADKRNAGGPVALPKVNISPRKETRPGKKAAPAKQPGPATPSAHHGPAETVAKPAPASNALPPVPDIGAEVAARALPPRPPLPRQREASAPFPPEQRQDEAPPRPTAVQATEEFADQTDDAEDTLSDGPPEEVLEAEARDASPAPVLEAHPPAFEHPDPDTLARSSWAQADDTASDELEGPTTVMDKSAIAEALSGPEMSANAPPDSASPATTTAGGPPKLRKMAALGALLGLILVGLFAILSSGNPPLVEEGDNPPGANDATQRDPNVTSPRSATDGSEPLPVAERPIHDSTSQKPRSEGEAAPDTPTPPIADPEFTKNVKRLIRYVEGCHPNGRMTGRGTLRMTVQPTGRVSRAVVADEPLASAPVGKCVVARAMGFSLPAFKGSPIELSEPFTLD